MIRCFEIKKIEHHLLHGGLPEPLLSSTKDPAFFSEWIDSFYARDIQEIFSIRNRYVYFVLSIPMETALSSILLQKYRWHVR